MKILAEEVMHQHQVNEAINTMLRCMLSKNKLNCKSCRDADARSFLTEAAFAYHCKKTIRRPLSSHWKETSENVLRYIAAIQDLVDSLHGRRVMRKFKDRFAFKVQVKYCFIIRNIKDILKWQVGHSGL